MQQGEQAELVTMSIGAEGLEIAGQAVAARAEGMDLVWSGGPSALAEGRVTLGLDPITLRPLLHGRATSKRSAPAALRGMGVIDEDTARTLLDGSSRLGLPEWAWRHWSRSWWERAPRVGSSCGRATSALRPTSPVCSEC
ncbi:hypothetical protein [Nannocystis radixulma]|uniref:Uncharacterized protein n=1 Tax=Nannocystis radixulma TaxID=2995305 RepID=A0ABT5BNF9_9BACT|nr:hypothetical protein [Nannocystis radixulma]MDC0675695.1 hypothetical protein [Nannocystis radixulma]